MIESRINNINILQFQLFEKNQVKTFISGREGGVSAREMNFNLSFSAPGESVENVQENRKRLAIALGIDPSWLVFPSQVHSENVAVVNEGNYKDKFQDTDALISDTPGVCLAVMSADCVPVLLYDIKNNAAAAIHAGWRGTVKRIVCVVIEKMKKQFNTLPENLIAGIGPSICQDAYEVGEEVIEAFENSFQGKLDSILKPGKPGKGFLDLWQANKILLMESGVPEVNIEIAGLCTYFNNDRFFSARKSDKGRFGAGVLVN